jgi:hypothetical protein
MLLEMSLPNNANFLGNPAADWAAIEERSLTQEMPIDNSEAH